MVKKLNLPEVIEFEWDEGNLEHIRKHNVEYSECEEVFYNEQIFFYDEKHSVAEDRFLTYGITDENRPLTLVFTIRNNKIRVVSARDQNKNERAVYNKLIKGVIKTYD